jgi:uncharacterized membrane protein HdeD (DUF308 family)
VDELRSIIDRIVASRTFWETVLPVTVVAIVTSLATAYFLTGSPAFVVPLLATAAFTGAARHAEGVRLFAARHPIALALAGAGVFAAGPANVLLLAPFVDILLLAVFAAVAGFWTGIAVSVSARELVHGRPAVRPAPRTRPAGTVVAAHAHRSGDLATQEIAWPR